MKKNMTKAELIEAIMKKTEKAKPMLRERLLKNLKTRTKAKLLSINRRIKVEDRGWNIRLT